MTKKKIDRLSVMYRHQINWLKWYYLKDKKNQQKTVLEQMIYDSFLQGNETRAAFLTNILSTTADYVEKSDPALLKTVKEVYVFERMNVIGACQTILFVTSSPAYERLNKWFENYLLETYKHIPIRK